MAKTNLFDYKEYKAYLIDAIDKKSASEKGQRSRLAEAISCQPAYLSQILNATADLSPEQAQATNAFLNHTPNEARYFLNLVLWARAGSKDLKTHYSEELKKQREDRLQLKNRVHSNRTLSETHQARYYSAWHFAAVHVAASVPHLDTKEKIAQALGLSQDIVNHALEFLVQIGLLQQSGNKYRQGEVSLYLGSDSPFIGKHHSNWRIKAIQSLDQIKPLDLHYSAVITCSNSDKEKIRELLVQLVQDIRDVVKDSKDETMCAYSCDLFGLIAKD